MTAPTIAPVKTHRPAGARRWTVSRSAVAILALWVAADVSLRFLPLTWFNIVDAVIARRWHPRDAPFTPNLRIHSAYYAGDEAIAGNLAPMETRPPRTFTTDRFGFRWTPAVRPGEPPRAVVLRGFSYSWGALMDDFETFPYRLARELDVNVYCGARFHEDAERPEDVRRLVDKLGANPSLAVYMHLEPNGHDPSWNTPHRLQRIGASVLGERYEDAEKTAAWLRFAIPTWLHVSPLEAMAVRASRAVRRGRFLANPRAAGVVSFALPDGTRMLNRAADINRVLHPPDDATVAARARFIAEWAHGLSRLGMTTVVVLVPEKMSVYGRELGLRLPDDPYLNRLERELKRHELRVVNLLPMLRAGAARDLATGHLAFFREDHHWSPDGVRRMAGFTAAAVRQSDVLHGTAP
jgi:hypothetical protein